jgi:branched-chain amino acid transport system substrate-binding protein
MEPAMTFSRRDIFRGATALSAAAAATALTGRIARADDPIVIGVSGPLTGPNAQYGAQWKDGFDLALIDLGDTIKGRKLTYEFEDSQSDPRQSVGIAQKFVADPRIVLEMGDFSSPASMAASPIYQRGKLVQFGFTNSHPDFTKGGDYMWSSSISQAEEQPQLADFTVTKLGFKKLGVMHYNTDWGRTSKDYFNKAATDLGATVTATEGFLPDEKDFRPTLVRVRDSNPDVLVIIAYYSDAALIARQARQQGMKQQIVAVSSVYSPKLIELGGDAVEGLYTQSSFSTVDPRPEVQGFMRRFQAKYNREPDAFNVGAYDAMTIAHAIMTQYGTDRASIRQGFEKIRDVPTVIFGKASFDPVTRRVKNPKYVHVQVRGGKWVPLTEDAKPA